VGEISFYMAGDDGGGRPLAVGFQWRLFFIELKGAVTPHVSKPHDYVNHMFMRL
jgi:hypothetical protein